MGNENLFELFENIYSALHFPVLICRTHAEMPVVYMNSRAKHFLKPPNSEAADYSMGAIEQHIQFSSLDALEHFAQMCLVSGYLSDYPAKLITFDKQEIPVNISGNRFMACGESLFVFYFVEPYVSLSSPADDENIFSSIINSALLISDMDKSISKTLELAAEHLKVSRISLFEDDTPNTAKVYEWRAGNIEQLTTSSVIKKDDFNFDNIVQHGLYIINNSECLDRKEIEIFRNRDFKSAAIITIYDGSSSLGFVMIEDCLSTRVWGHQEIRFLQNISIFLSALLKRRDAEQITSRSQQIFQLIADNSVEYLFANSIYDYRIVFASKPLCESSGFKQEELLGRQCYDLFGDALGTPCPDCPMERLKKEHETNSDYTHVREHKNKETGKTFLIKDSLVRWVDGRLVHMESAVDITERTLYEEKLRFLASTDVLTCVYKREWGQNVLAEKMVDPSCEGSLIFIDVDGLKHVNDNMGHSFGDELLKKIVSAISDDLPEGSFMCRWGGDEFIVWSNLSTDMSFELMAKIQIKLKQASENNPFAYSFSYGVVPFIPSSDASLDQLITKADELMYRNKMNKRGLRRRRNDNVDMGQFK